MAYTFPQIVKSEWDEIPVPDAELVGQVIYVIGGANVADFIVYARNNINTSPEWVLWGDHIQVPLVDDVTLTDVPFASTAFPGPGVAVDAQEYAEVRWSARVITAGVTSDAYLYYSNAPGTWAQLTANGIDLSATGITTTAWEEVPFGARLGPMLVQPWSINGDAAEDPRLYAVVAHFRR